MTGYGHGEATAACGSVTVEISSVNGKRFDFRLDCDRTYSFLEPMILEAVRKKIERGSLTCRTRITPAESNNSKFRLIDNECAARYAREIKSLATLLELSDDVGVSTITGLPGVIKPKTPSLPDKQVWNVFSKALNTALNSLVRMRTAEGIRLANDLSKRLALLQRWTNEIERLSQKAAVRHVKKLQTRIAELGMDGAYDKEKFYREIVLLADRSDISEEITRISSHITHSLSELNSGKPAGRTLEFISQELLREINTIGSKSQDKGISERVIKSKSEIERIREQIANVE